MAAAPAGDDGSLKRDKVAALYLAKYGNGLSEDNGNRERFVKLVDLVAQQCPRLLMAPGMAKYPSLNGGKYTNFLHVAVSQVAMGGQLKEILANLAMHGVTLKDE